VSEIVSFDGDLARLAFDLSPSGMLAIDAEGTIVLVNRETERLFGWSRDELIGRSVETLVPPSARAVHPGHRHNFDADPRSRPMGVGRELHGVRRDGTEFPVEIGLNPVTLGDRRFVFASIVDITSRRAMEESLRRSQKLEAVGVLAGGIAHDFNNILLGIMGHTELALREDGSLTQRQRDLGKVLKGAERGRQLVQRILAFSRATEVARVPLRLDRTVAESLELIRASLPATVEIRAELDPGAPTVLSDETQIHQILMNLATNAAHAMPRGGVLTVKLRTFDPNPETLLRHPGMRAGPHARLEITDDGAGMTAEVLERVLEPFFTTKPVGQGTGLGMSVIHGIVRGHGGTIEIESAPGRGTTVTIDLPAGNAPAPAPVESVVTTRDGSGPRVLLVEDEPDLASMQRRQLEHLGYRVTVHTSSVEALEDFRSRPAGFDLLVTDATMPRMTGAELTREIVGLRADLPVLMVTGGDGADPEVLKRIGVRRVLRKPHTSRELERAIRDTLRPAE
jgi:PAS domain S-box-containing protein